MASGATPFAELSLVDGTSLRGVVLFGGGGDDTHVCVLHPDLPVAGAAAARTWRATRVPREWVVEATVLEEGPEARSGEGAAWTEVARSMPRYEAVDVDVVVEDAAGGEDGDGDGDGDEEAPPRELSPVAARFWRRRRRLFARFDEGVRVPDDESWFSVTPEAVARHIAASCAGLCVGGDADVGAGARAGAGARGLVVDACAGCGGNAVQFALAGFRVLALEIDPARASAAEHNARVYGVSDRVRVVTCDAVEALRRLPRGGADVVFASPPWGGPGYKNLGRPFDLEADVDLGRGNDGVSLLLAARSVASRAVVAYLPRNTDLAKAAQAVGASCRAEAVFAGRERSVPLAVVVSWVASPPP